MGGQVSAVRHGNSSSAETEKTSVAATAEARYALALYELAEQHQLLDAVSRDLAALQRAIAASGELRALLSRPMVRPIDQAKALEAIAGKLGLVPLTKKFLGVLIKNRRLKLLASAIEAFMALEQDRRGETVATVSTAFPLTDGQARALTESLNKMLNKHVTLDITEDKDLLGGIVVRTGSRIFDGSLRNKLNNLKRRLAGAA